MTLFDILSKNERILVWSNESNGAIYTWNQSLTLQCWYQQHMNHNDSWEEIDVRVLNDTPASFVEARDAALAWDRE